MLTVYLQLLGVAAFFVATLVIGARIRRAPTKASAQVLSRVSHGFFWGGMVAPELLSAITPGLWSFDSLFGLPPLPGATLRLVVGGCLLVLGNVFMLGSTAALRKLGSGLMAFKLTQKVVNGGLYQRVRNPMSLGWYLSFIGASFVVGSSYLLLFTVVLYIPVHAFNLIHFEEHELSARHGPSYDEYRRRVPFIIPSLTPAGVE
jgi:protein-S-isoprenylcysteine O-methyltransferase Ste14